MSSAWRGQACAPTSKGQELASGSRRPRRVQSAPGLASRTFSHRLLLLVFQQTPFVKICSNAVIPACFISGTQKLITEILQRANNGLFGRSGNKRVIWIHSRWTAVVLFYLTVEGEEASAPD